MTERLLLVFGVLIVVIGVGLVGVWQFGSGLDQKGLVAARNPRDAAERMQRSLRNRIERAVRRTTVGRYTERRLAAAGMGMQVVTFLAMLAAATVAAVFFAWKVLAPLFGVLAVVLISWVFFQFLRQREERRKEEFIGQLPELARVMSNAFSAGLALRTAVDLAAEELDDPAGTELRKTADALRLGQPIDDALEDLNERLPSRELSVLVSTLVISNRAGGSLVTALRNISSTLESRKEVRREVKTVLSQSTYTAYFVVALAVGELFMVNSIAEGGLRALTSSAAGIIVLALSGLFFALGLFLVRRLNKVDV